MNVLTYIAGSFFLLLTPENYLCEQVHINIRKNQEQPLGWYQKTKLVPNPQTLEVHKRTRWNRQNNDEEEWFIFDEVEVKSSTTQRNSFDNFLIPGMGTTQSSCEDNCQTTREYNPACGDDNITYYNPARLICAQRCGKRVYLKHLGRCSVENPFG